MVLHTSKAIDDQPAPKILKIHNHPKKTQVVRQFECKDGVTASKFGPSSRGGAGYDSVDARHSSMLGFSCDCRRAKIRNALKRERVIPSALDQSWLLLSC